ncbi:MAG: DUF2807 domain-containing protein [Muribaculaceae bacterium]|nr:DUF2807 domain-containing protein [Muribaculaceae bacterium]
MKPNLLFTTLASSVLLLGSTSFTACAKVKVYFGKGASLTASKNIIKKSVNIDSFNSVSIPSIIDVVYTQQGGNSVARIEAPDNLMEYVSVEVNGGTLTVTLKDLSNLNLDMNNQNILCYVNSSSLSNIDISGTGDFNCTSLNTDKLTLSIGGTGDISFNNVKCTSSVQASIGGTGDIDIDNLECSTLSASVGGTGDIDIDNLQATSVSANVGGTGDIELKGNVTDANYTANGTGDIKARNLVANNVVAHAEGTGDIECYANKSINASGSMTASVTYWGSPSSVQTGKNVSAR